MASSSSGSTITCSPSPTSAPLTMSAKSTSSPVRSLTRLLRTRSEVPRSNWWKWIVWSSVALNSPTGMDTSPKLMDPVQIARAISSPLPVSHWGSPRTYPVPGCSIPARQSTNRQNGCPAGSR